MRFIKIMFLLFIVVVAVIFSLSNREFVTINLFPFPFKIDTPLFMIFILSFALGTISSSAKFFISSIGARRVGYRHKQKIQALENEINGMRVDNKIKASI